MGQICLIIQSEIHIVVFPSILSLLFRTFQVHVIMSLTVLYYKKTFLSEIVFIKLGVLAVIYIHVEQENRY